MNYIPHQPVLPRKRPGTVTFAAALMVGMTVIFAIIGGIAMYALLTVEVASDSSQRGLRITGIVTGTLCFAVGLGVIGLALGVLRGHGGARTATFVVYGAFILCGFCGFGLWLLGMSEGTGSNVAQGGVVLLGLTFIEVVILVATVVLLAGTKSREWFAEHRRARAAGLL